MTDNQSPTKACFLADLCTNLNQIERQFSWLYDEMPQWKRELSLVAHDAGESLGGFFHDPRLDSHIKERVSNLTSEFFKFEDLVSQYRIQLDEFFGVSEARQLILSVNRLKESTPSLELEGPAAIIICSWPEHQGKYFGPVPDDAVVAAVRHIENAWETISLESSFPSSGRGPHNNNKPSYSDGALSFGGKSVMIRQKRKPNGFTWQSDVLQRFEDEEWPKSLDFDDDTPAFAALVRRLDEKASKVGFGFRLRGRK